ncbi:hypothetical protein SAMN04489712_11151 [Thermomonospora echinospora]|uniref:Uncharacterized protein n=1 Tax=Thermomonospora echinospora TaxID=1992 RepID=A0A1H6CS90_9ACTN|nr:hypothetical protein SAMN04489712_11151 [Thermomonospora echinospora]
MTGFINSEAGAHAIYYARCYHHQGIHEAYIDVVLDDYWDPDDVADRPSPNRVTFGCRIGPIEGHPNIACSLVTGASVAPDSPLYGRKLDPDQAREHPWLTTYWETIDHILEHDETVARHFQGPTAAEHPK